MAKENDDFFIGWAEETPDSYSKASKNFVWILIPIFGIIASLFVFSQLQFATSSFEFGTLRSVTGTLHLNPVPVLTTNWGTNQAPQHILLVGAGKIGAESTLEEIASTQGKAIDGQSVTLEGTLIYYDGKVALELTNGPEAFKEFSNATTLSASIGTKKNATELRGEIVDPKCFFGVMKPADGKPHKSCAIRCISGGIPPIFASTTDGKTDYYVMFHTDGSRLQKELLPYVADHLKISGESASFNDWKVLYLSPERDICRLGPKGLWGEQGLCQR